jgi:inorganic pyrophosphatase
MNESKIKQPKEFPTKVNVLIEIPRGSDNKYEVDKETGFLKLDRPLFSSIHYPGDYGYIPNTLWDDGDPIDILVLTSHPVYPLTLATVRIVGMLDMIDGKESDTKIIGVYDSDPRFSEYKDIDNLRGHKLKEIVHFFESYKQLQGKKVTIKSVKGKKEAMKAILKSKELFERKYGRQ